MKIPQSEAMENYRTGFFAGFSVSEVLIAAVTCIGCVLLIMLFMFVGVMPALAMILSSFLITPVPFYFFFRPNGLTLLQIIRYFLYLLKFEKLYYVSTEEELITK